jgi:non-ribosomal peptide synthetase component F
MQLSTISFDASIFEIYYTLLNNGSLILYPHADIEFRILNNFLSKYKIDVLWLTAAFFDKWVYTLKKDDIRVGIFGCYLLAYQLECFLAYLVCQ